MLLRTGYGGTEISTYELSRRLHNYKRLVSVSDAYQRKRVLHMHQNFDQPSVQMIRGMQDYFEKIVFVSEYQRQMFQRHHDVRDAKCMVIGNGVNPLPIYHKPIDCINLVYMSTPFRGLDVLIEAFIHMSLPDVYLHVFSSMEIYGRTDDDYKDLYNKIKTTPNARYYGAVAPAFLQEWIAKNGHILAYPNHWAETYCMAAHEAQSANMLVVSSDLGALPETVPFGIQYPFVKDFEEHVNVFTETLQEVIENYKSYASVLKKQKIHADRLSWNQRASEWQILLNQYK